MVGRPVQKLVLLHSDGGKARSVRFAGAGVVDLQPCKMTIKKHEEYRTAVKTRVALYQNYSEGIRDLVAFGEDDGRDSKACVYVYYFVAHW